MGEKKNLKVSEVKDEKIVEETTVVEKSKEELKEIEKKFKKEESKKYRDNIASKLREVKAAKIPFLIDIEGWDAAGKSYVLNELIKNIDPRFYSVYIEEAYQDQERYPYMYRYYELLPQDGNFRFMDGGYLYSTANSCMEGELSEDDYITRIKLINDYERTIINNGYVVLKLFLDISEKEQAKRIANLKSKKKTAWRIGLTDLNQNANYKTWKKAFKSVMDDTSTFAPWHIIDAKSRTNLKYEALKLLSETIDNALSKGKFVGKPYKEEFEMAPVPDINKMNLNQVLTKEEYDEKLKEAEDRLKKLCKEVYRKQIPFVLAFEGWDAAGKGGAIKRVAYPLDPRDFQVIPIASPTVPEKERHFLWRFWTRLPKSGHIHIFDRTWYGRVMVERLEGFCSDNDWKRAFNEINEFEEGLTKEGVVVLKFWLQIDKDTQLARFTERQNTPEKQWKITDEDWRNREKWDDYEKAIKEMFKKTSTKAAPWHIIESNDKLYARIKVMTIVADSMEEALKNKK